MLETPQLSGQLDSACAGGAAAGDLLHEPGQHMEPAADVGGVCRRHRGLHQIRCAFLVGMAQTACTCSLCSAVFQNGQASRHRALHHRHYVPSMQIDTKRNQFIEVWTCPGLVVKLCRCSACRTHCSQLPNRLQHARHVQSRTNATLLTAALSCFAVSAAADHRDIWCHDVLQCVQRFRHEPRHQCTLAGEAWRVQRGGVGILGGLSGICGGNAAVGSPEEAAAVLTRYQAVD